MISMLKITAAATALALVAAVPSSAKIVQFAVTGTITAGSDGGTDLDSVDLINNVLTEFYVPGTIFGTAGSLVGKTIAFRMSYDTATAPVGSGGVFDDSGDPQWSFDSAPRISIGGVTHDFIDVVAGGSLGLGSIFTIVDGTPDGLSGAFHSQTSAGNVINVFHASNFDFSALLPAGFFASDAVLPGDASLSGFGLGGAVASGTGTFYFSRQSCFIGCSNTTASGSFSLSSIAFVPEAPAWALMIGGFGLVGTMSRRRHNRMPSFAA